MPTATTIGHSMWDLKHWLARLSFSLLILSGLCAWTVYQALPTTGWSVPTLLWLAGAIAAGFVGLVGVRMRHL